MSIQDENHPDPANTAGFLPAAATPCSSHPARVGVRALLDHSDCKRHSAPQARKAIPEFAAKSTDGSLALRHFALPRDQSEGSHDCLGLQAWAGFVYMISHRFKFIVNELAKGD